MPPNKSHHHGRLREALIEAGMELLAESGTEGLTLRRTAARAGVTHAAPAHHFAGLEGLRNAIAERGFDQFLETLRAAGNDESADGYERLLATNLAYLKFAEDNPGLFDLMFSQIKHGSGSLKEAAGRCYATFRAACARVEHNHDKVAFEFTVWAVMHGYAALDMPNRRPLNGEVTPPKYPELLKIILSASTSEK